MHIEIKLIVQLLLQLIIIKGKDSKPLSKIENPEVKNEDMLKS